MVDILRGYKCCYAGEESGAVCCGVTRGSSVGDEWGCSWVEMQLECGRALVAICYVTSLLFKQQSA